MRKELKYTDLDEGTTLAYVDALYKRSYSTEMIEKYPELENIKEFQEQHDKEGNEIQVIIRRNEVVFTTENSFDEEWDKSGLAPDVLN